MIERAHDVDAYIDALLDITSGNYVKAAIIVCKDIEIKESSHQISSD